MSAVNHLRNATRQSSSSDRKVTVKTTKQLGDPTRQSSSPDHKVTFTTREGQVTVHPPRARFRGRMSGLPVDNILAEAGHVAESSVTLAVGETVKKVP